MAGKREETDWKGLIRNTAEVLARGVLSEQDEDRLANEVNKKLSELVRGEWIPVVELKAGLIYTTDYLSRGQLAKRPDLAEWARRNGKSDELRTASGLTEVESYLGGFARADREGYETELGKTWVFMEADVRGTFYIPAWALQGVGGISY